MDAFEDILKARYTISPMIHTNPYHVEVIRTPLTRNINVRFDDIRDEIIAAFSDHITTQDHEWAELPTAETARKIVVRTSNRLFVGLPLCKIVGRVFTKRNESMRRALRHLAPVIEERLRMHDEHGSEWASRPNDYISWLIEATEYQAEDWQKGSVEDLTLRILAVNFAAIHTTSMALTFALHNLAANPHHAEPLRREVEMVVGQEGWTKGAMVKLRLMDSFLKESQRPNGGSSTFKHVSTIPTLTLKPVAMINRKAKKDFKFSDGTIVPAGTHISVATEFTHCNEATYPDPNGFNATRFSDLRDKEGEGLKHQMVTPTPDWLSFGTGESTLLIRYGWEFQPDDSAGKHACPGRFFAVSEIKAMLAHVLLNYDVKFKDDAPCPPAMNIAGNAGPDENAKVMFRKRINTSTL
ncbi:hypothetical protein VNI00_006880 [Paramarasmius palmivorus]|uniref:Cytochrome P450 n=1 Tax=Paramarasmius palmivorus TaxID=297713 RepID=A0AAW0D757_9AGAR